MKNRFYDKDVSKVERIITALRADERYFEAMMFVELLYDYERKKFGVIEYYQSIWGVRKELAEAIYRRFLALLGVTMEDRRIGILQHCDEMEREIYERMRNEKQI